MSEKKHLSKGSLVTIVLASLIIFGLIIFNQIAYEEIRKTVEKTIKPFEEAGLEVEYEIPMVPIVDILSQKTKINKIEVKYPDKRNLRVDSLVIREMNLRDLKVDFSLENLRLPMSFYDINKAPPMIKNYMQAFKKSGIKEEDDIVSDLSLKLDYKDQDDAGKLFADVLINTDKLLNIDMNTELTNITLSDFLEINNMPRETQQEKMMYMVKVQKTLSKVNIEKMNFEMKDKGLSEAIVKQTAEISNKSEEESREAILKSLEGYQEVIKDENLLVIIKELSEFFQK